MKAKELAEILNRTPGKEVMLVEPDPDGCGGAIMSPVVEAYVNDHPFTPSHFIICSQSVDAALKKAQAEEAAKPVEERTADYIKAVGKLFRGPTILALALIFLTGCTMISYDRVMPKLAWAWTYQAKEQRRQNREYEAGKRAYQDSLKTNTVTIKP